MLEITSIAITDGLRTAKVFDPETGRYNHHGLGVVGEPLLPFLGNRAEGYDLALPDDLRDLRVFRKEWASRDAARPRITYLPLDALGAPDLTPTPNEED